MSISYELYNAPPDKAMMNSWDKDYSFPIDSPEVVKKRLENIFPRIKIWMYHDRSQLNLREENPYFCSHSTLGEDNCNPMNEYLDISLTQLRDGFIHRISIRKGSPKVVRMVLEEFELMYVFEGQSCKLIDPYKYDGNWELIDNAL